MNYAELFCQSNFSFLTGASHAEELVLQAAFTAIKPLQSPMNVPSQVL